MRRMAVLVALLSLGCGYRTNFTMPEGIKTYAVKVFKNDTLYQNADFEFTQELFREMNAKTPLKVAESADADLIISGSVATYQRRVLREAWEDQVAEYQLVIGVNVKFEKKDGTVLYEGKNIQRAANYSITRGRTERWARDQVMSELARKVVSLAFERW